MGVKGWRRVPREQELDQSKAPITRLARDADDCECAEEPELLTFSRKRRRRSELAHDRQRIRAAARDLCGGHSRTTAQVTPCHLVEGPTYAEGGGESERATSANSARAASRSSTISCAITSGGGRFSRSSSDSSLSHTRSRLTLSRCSSSSYVNRLKRSDSDRARRSSAEYAATKSCRCS